MASIRKRVDRPSPWEAVYRDPDGRQHTRSFARKVDAQHFITTVEADKLRGSYVDPRAGKVMFRVFADSWLAAQTFDESSRETTHQRLRVHIYPTFGDVELRAIRPSAVQAWLRDRSASNAASHVRVMLVNLSAILNAAVEDSLIAKNPCAVRSVRAPRVDRSPVVPWPTARVLAVSTNTPTAGGPSRPLPLVAGCDRARCSGCASRTSTFSAGGCTCEGR